MAESNTASHIVFEHYDRDDERRREALLALGNGVLSWRASAPEAAAMSDADDSKHYAGFYRAGWYDQAPREVNGDTVHMAHWSGKGSSYQQTIAARPKGV